MRRAAPGEEPAGTRAAVADPARAGAWTLLAAGVLAQVAYPLLHGDGRATLTIAVVALMGAAAALGAIATLGAHAGLAVAGSAAVLGFAADAAGANTGYPFGGYAYDGQLGPQAAAVPLIVALAWVMGAVPAIAAARRLRPATSPAALVGQVAVAALGLWAWDLFLDPQMVADGRWRWDHPRPGLPGVTDVPLTNAAGWAVASIAIASAGCAIARRADRARPPRPGRIEPGEAQFLWTWLSSALAHAAFLGLPASAAWGAVGMGAVGVPLIVALARDARRSRHAARGADADTGAAAAMPAGAAASASALR